LIDIFDGMVRIDGVQEDPIDNATLAIGLAPTYLFDNYQNTSPWTFYDGSVSLRVSYAEVNITMNQSQNLPFNLSITTIILIAGAAVVIGTGVGILRWKRRNLKGNNEVLWH
jgi:hypothetical protein